MRLKEIKRKADQIYKKNRKQVISEFFLVGYMSMLAQYLREGLFSFFVSLFLSPITHGYVKCSMKLVDDNQARLDYQDSLIGIVDFPRVAPVYFMRKAVVMFVTFLCALPLLIRIIGVMPHLSLELIGELGNSMIQTEIFIPDLSELFIILSDVKTIINISLCFVVYLWMNALFMPVAYIMELEDFSWNESFVLSVKMMKGYMGSYIGLCVLYVLRHFIYWILIGIMMMFIGSMNEILMLICMVLSLLLHIELFKGRFEIAKYLFFKEMRDGDEKSRFSEEDCD